MMQTDFMNFIDASLFYSIEIIKFIVMAFFLLGIKVKSKNRLFITVISTIVLTGFLGVCIPEFAKKIDIFVLLAMGMIILKRKNDIGYIVLSYLYILIIDSAMVMVLFRGSIAKLIKENSFLYSLSNMPALIILVMLVIIKFKRIDKTELTETRKSVLILAMGAFGLFLALAAIAAFYQQNSTVIIDRLKILFVILALLYLAVLIFYISNRIQVITLTKQNIGYSQVMKINEEYYNMLRKKEDETRAFRHDTKAHLYCLQTLYKEKNFEEFEKYLSELTEQFNEISNRIMTGNNLVNAIVNDISTKYPDVSIQWNGNFSEDITINSIDICTIFSNLLNNAFEAANLTEDKKVCVLVKTLESSVYISIKNSALSEPLQNDDGYISTKDDGIEHGYGLRNVKKCLEKLGGSFDIMYENYTVIVDIILSDALIVTND